MRRLNCRPKRRVPAGERGEALLVEVIVSSMVLVTAFSMAASMSGIAAKALRTSSDVTNVAHAVTENIADINDLASRYTYCSGKPGFAACNGDNPARYTYYTPLGSPTLMESFQAACKSTTFNSALLQEINALPVPTGVTRTATTDAGLNDLQTHRIRISFTIDTNTSSSQRVEVIVPNVASFCP